LRESHDKEQSFKTKIKSMKKQKYILLLALITHLSAFSQKLEWKVGLNYFFDNTEYAKSTLTKDQTMTGVHFTSQMGVSLDSVHSFYAGVDLLKTAGSVNIIDMAQPVAYYRYHTPKVSFYAGSFLRSEVLSNYSDLFFQDSVNYYRPTMHGIFWKMGTKNSYFNLWLDWTGHQTAVNRETFFVGASAHKQFRNLFADFQSYMFHFADTRPMNLTYSVCDNLLAHLSVGVDLSRQLELDTLMFAVGVLAGAERDRGELNGTHVPVGAVIRLNAEYLGFGTQNMMYIGNPRDVFYAKYNTGMYWNNPFLQSGFYLESNWFVDVLNSQSVAGRLNLNLHFSEGKVMYEQVFTLRATLDSSVKPSTKSKPAFFSKWFK
jgi:hypothetical protein